MTAFPEDPNFLLDSLGEGYDGELGNIDNLGYFAQDLADLLPTNELPTAPAETTEAPLDSNTSQTNTSEIKQRRRRKPLNCEFCRQRKLKCDRQDPCATCVKKKRGHMCFYTNRTNTIGGRVAKSKDLLKNSGEQVQILSQKPPAPVTLTGGQGMGVPVTVGMYADKDFTQKIQQSGLNETLSMLNVGVEEDDVTEIESLRQSLGMMKLGSRGNAIYHGESHWGSLFSEAAEVTDFFDEVRKQDGWSTSCVDPATQSHKMNLSALSQEGSNRLAEILQLLPARQNSDKLVKRYFEACEPLLNLLDEENFMKEYEQFWETPEDTQILWLGLLLGVLSLALQSCLDYRLDDAALDRLTTAWTEWLKGIDHCLEQAVVGVRASMVNIQALLLWVCVQTMGNSEADYVDASWTSFGSLVRVAQSMGLHREPAWFRMTPEHQEKRRSVWALICEMDVHFSLVEGLPQSIHKDSTDVRPPFSADNFSKARGILHQIFLQNYSIASVQTIPYDQVLLLGAKLKKVYQEHKEAVLTDSEDDFTLNMMKGLVFEVDYLKMTVAIHRVFASQGLSAPRYRRSREECVSASLRILQLSVWFFTAATTEKIRCLYRWFFSAFIFPTVIHSHLFVTISLIRNFHSLDYTEREKQKSILLDSIALMANQGKIHRKLEKQFQVCQMLYKKVLNVENEPPKADAPPPMSDSTATSSPYSQTTSPYSAANHNTIFLDLDLYPSQVFDLPPDMRMNADAVPSAPNKDYIIPQKFDSEWDDLMNMIDQKPSC